MRPPNLNCLEGLVKGAPGLTARQAHEAWPAGAGRPPLRAVAGRLLALSEAGRLVRSRLGRGAPA